MKNISLKSNQCIATCPACGLLCDDILVENNQNVIKVLANGCAKSIAFFEQPLHDAAPQIAGEPASLAQALAKAAQILKEAKQPLFTGLSTDVAGFRAIYNLAQKSNASLQHMNAASTARNIKVLQSTGWQTTTLTEVKNRADVIACIGSDIVLHNPRFFERFVDVDGMFISAKNRQLIVLGESKNNGVIKSDTLEAAWILPCRADDLPSVTIALRALVAGKQLKVAEIAGIKVSDLQSVADKLIAAKYAVLAWVAKDLDFPHAELTIQNITETVAILNQSASNHLGRAAGLPLGGSDGDTSANNANTWLSGLALNDIANEHDCVVWVNSFSADKLPPITDKPLIILGSSNPVGAACSREPEQSQLQAAPTLFIPIATPGLDYSGTLFRVDSSVILPLKKLRENNLPTLSEVVSGIEALL
ncbi:MAG: formylmethanofuran dehydrogenase [Methylotenera sp.]|nr:formylmethanofuran dehydrogenase [Methylotenera sp.]